MFDSESMVYREHTEIRARMRRLEHIRHPIEPERMVQHVLAMRKHRLASEIPGATYADQTLRRLSRIATTTRAVP